MSPVTMRAKIILPEQVQNIENKYNNDYYDRVVWMIEDLLSAHYIDYCARWLGMPTYEEMYDLIITYFKTIQDPISYSLRPYDPLTGNRYLIHDVLNNNKPRQIYSLIDNNQKRKIYTLTERMPKK